MSFSVIFTGGEFVAHARASEKPPGFFWDPVRKIWYTRNLGAAARLRRQMDESARKVIDRYLIRYRPWSGGLPHPKRFTPYDYQKDPAAVFALSRSRSYLGLAPRLGKTVVSALVINALQAPAVFITPPFLTRTIESEFRDWLVRPVRLMRLDPKEPALFEPEVLVVPDSIIHRPEVRRELIEFALSARRIGIEPILFTDEAHRYKSPKAIRTKSLLGAKGITGIFRAFSRVVFLSGTPMLNRPLEMYPILSKAAPETIDFMSEVEYGMRYCAGRLVEETCPRCYGRHGGNCRYCGGKGKFEHGYDFSGASRLSELRAKVHGKFMLRIKKVPGLPAKVEEIAVIGDRPPKLIEMEAEVLAYYSPTDLIEGTVSSDHVATYRRELGALKVKPAIDFIRSLLDDGEESILVFAFHREVVERLSEGLKRFRPLVIQGGISNARRDEIQKLYQTDPSRRLFIGNYVAAGLGLKLSKADRVVMVEYSWTPTENDQASDRANEIGRAHV